MNIPSYAMELIDRLENAGYEAWAVGGCVRDSFLGLAPHDWDLCTSALPEQTKAVFCDRALAQNGEKHGTIGVVTEGGLVEITTYRTEGDYADSRHPQWVHFENNIAADLSRRDFTINAMAYHPRRGIKDPWGGKEDLERGILRAVGDPARRFQEDGLRILRGIRFAARFSLRPEERTLEAMKELAYTLPQQAVERVFTELCGFLLSAGREELLTFAPILTAALPELAPMVGFRQNNPHHIYDIYTHTAYVVAGTPQKLAVRWAALLHDMAKPQTYGTDERGTGHFYGHAQLGGEAARELLHRLRAPKALTETVAELIVRHGTCRDIGAHGSDKSVRRLLRTMGQERVYDLLALDWADSRGKGTPPDTEALTAFQTRLARICAQPLCCKTSELTIGGRELMALGIPQGPAIGAVLTRLLDEVTDGTTENEASTLLRRVEEWIKTGAI